MSGSASLCRGRGSAPPPTRSRKTVKFIKISAAPSIDGNRSTATSCKFATASQSASLTAPLGGGAFLWRDGAEGNTPAASPPPCRLHFLMFSALYAEKAALLRRKNAFGRTTALLAPRMPSQNKKAIPYGMTFCFGGAEGNRTPVRKQLDRTFSGRSLLFTFPRCGGNRHSSHLGSFMMHDAGKAYCVHGRRFVTPKPGSRPFRGGRVA